MINEIEEIKKLNLKLNNEYYLLKEKQELIKQNTELKNKIRNLKLEKFKNIIGDFKKWLSQ